MDIKKICIRENGVLTPIQDTNKVFCGLYAAVGYNGEKAGDLFVVVCGPVLWPAYDKSGKRINVGEDLAGLSYNYRLKEWRKE